MIELTQEDLAKLLSSGPRHVHLVGIGGSGMNGLAKLLVERGHRVSGSDWSDEAVFESLRKMGVQCFKGHAAENLLDVDFVSYSSAIPSNNPELEEANRRGIPIVRRARTLSALIGSQKAIIVSGTHGKTTTTSMIATILKRAGRKPSFFVGAMVNSLGTNAEIGRGEEFVIEADESDGSMNEFKPDDLVILNVEAEHLDFYENLAEIEKAFTEIALTASNAVYFCKDDPGASRVGSVLKNAHAYSVADKGATWYAQSIESSPGEISFDVYRNSEKLGRIKLQIPGRHNVSNALAALAVTLNRQVSFNDAAQALSSFTGASRRFQRLYESDQFLVVDDYAHHPTEIRATIHAARQKGRKRIVVGFQPHRFTRTRALHADFGKALNEADRIFIADVYAASETPIVGVSGKLVADAVISCAGRDPNTVTFESNLWQLKDAIGHEINENDLVLIMGAGNIAQISKVIANELRVFDELKNLLSDRSVVKRYEPMSKRTTMRTGGYAKIWVEPFDETDLSKLLKFCSEKRRGAADPVQKSYYEVSFIGRGSNLLVRDAGISGVTVHLGSDYFKEISFDGERVMARAGAKLKQVVLDAKKQNLTGLEYLEGIPGTVGGGLYMNAGAMGNNMFDRVESVRMMDMDGNVFEKKPSELGVEYRKCQGLRNHVAVSAILKAEKGTPEKISAKLKEFEHKRWESQPAAPSAGCIFKNPSTIPAGKLIDELGLKGLKFGKASVSLEHGNFIVNNGGASATEIMSLISMIKDRVRKERGIELETEVIIFGDDRW